MTMLAMKLPLSVPVRFLAAIVQIVLTSLLMLHRPWNVSGCDGDDQEYIIGLSLLLGITALEMLSLALFGFTLYSFVQTFVSIVLHLSGIIALLFYMFSRSCSRLIWPIFAVCSALPFTTEIISIVASLILKRFNI